MVSLRRRYAEILDRPIYVYLDFVLAIKVQRLKCQSLNQPCNTGGLGLQTGPSAASAVSTDGGALDKNVFSSGGVGSVRLFFVFARCL